MTITSNIPSFSSLFIYFALQLNLDIKKMSKNEQVKLYYISFEIWWYQYFVVKYLSAHIGVR